MIKFFYVFDLVFHDIPQQIVLTKESFPLTVMNLAFMVSLGVILPVKSIKST